MGSSLPNDLPRFVVKDGTRVLRFDDETQTYVGKIIEGREPIEFGGAVFSARNSVKAACASA